MLLLNLPPIQEALDARRYMEDLWEFDPVTIYEFKEQITSQRRYARYPIYPDWKYFLENENYEPEDLDCCC